jgi:hypothetical protein
MALLVAFAALSLVTLLGGPDPLGDASALVFGALMLAWFGVALREDPPRAGRRVLWVGVMGGALLIAASALELL